MKRLLFCLIVCCSSIQAMEKVVRRFVINVVLPRTQSSPCSTTAAFKFDSDPGDEEILKQLRRIRLHKQLAADLASKKSERGSHNKTR